MFVGEVRVKENGVGKKINIKENKTNLHIQDQLNEKKTQLISQPSRLSRRHPQEEHSQKQYE